MTLLEIERLNRRIAESLQPGGNADAAPRLAEEFANACHAANLRLQQCESMIHANDRLQAVIRANHRFALLQAQIRGVAGVRELFGQSRRGVGITTRLQHLGNAAIQTFDFEKSHSIFKFLIVTWSKTVST